MVMRNGWARRLAPAALLLCLLAPVAGVRAADPGAEAGVASSPVHLPGTYQFDLVSRDGRPYRIFVSEPAGPAPAGGWPVVYVLDGNAWFAHASQQLRVRGAKRPDKTGVLPGVVVGVGYTGEGYIQSLPRTWDFTPPAPLRVPNPASWGPTGGADRFLEFLTGELRPLIARRYRIDPRREVLFGHSLGGLFALHAYFSRPQAFAAVVAASASTWWNGDYIIEQAEAFARAGKVPASRLLVATGAEELDYMVEGARRVGAALEPMARAGAGIELELLPGEDHLSAAPVAIGRLVQRYLRPTAQDLAALRAGEAAAQGLQLREHEVDAGEDGTWRVHEYRAADRAGQAPARALLVLEDGVLLQAALAHARQAARPTVVLAVRDAGDAVPGRHALSPSPSSDERGGAEALLRALEARVLPEVLGQDAGADVVVLGSGQAGVFALYALANAPWRFPAVVALDPALDWHNRFIFSPNVIGRLGPKLSSRQAAARVRVLSAQPQVEDPARLGRMLEAMSGVDAQVRARGPELKADLGQALAEVAALEGQVPVARPPVFEGDTGLPVPAADEYLAMDAEQRFQLRMRLRALDKPRQEAWTRRFKYNLDAALPYYEHRLLHEEKTRMDQLHGYVPPG